MKYNDNITIDFIKRAKQELKQNEYFALMVVDELNRFLRKECDYFDYRNAWVGLECKSNKEIYISKNFDKRVNYSRGIVVIAIVKDVSKCCIL